MQPTCRVVGRRAEGAGLLLEAVGEAVAVGVDVVRVAAQPLSTPSVSPSESESATSARVPIVRSNSRTGRPGRCPASACRRSRRRRPPAAGGAARVGARGHLRGVRDAVAVGVRPERVGVVVAVSAESPRPSPSVSARFGSVPSRPSNGSVRPSPSVSVCPGPPSDGAGQRGAGHTERVRGAEARRHPARDHREARAEPSGRDRGQLGDHGGVVEAHGVAVNTPTPSRLLRASIVRPSPRLIATWASAGRPPVGGLEK